jgi:hypothetical protein
VPPRLVLVTRFLLVVGLLLIVAGGGGAGLAVVDPALVRAQLPPVAIDAAAVGGALAALGFASVALGAVHLVAVAGLRRRARWATTATVVLAATLSMLWLAAAVAALVSARQGAGFVAAGIGLAVLALAYAVCAGSVIVQMRPNRPSEGRPEA